MKRKDFVCHDCFRLKKCKHSGVSWVFFFTALIATISIRLVNVFIGFSEIAAKVSWYVGIIGFFFYFLYRYRYDDILHKELLKTKLTDKMLNREKLTEHDYDVLGTLLCKIDFKKDKVNYFFIFFTSGVALLIGIYTDFFKR